MGKRALKLGQMQISFGMIFSIILIIFFLAFAFYAIKMFLGASDTAKTANFVKELQGDIVDLWKAPQGSKEKTYSMSSKVEEICFIEDDYENLVFLPPNSEELAPIVLEHIDITNITRSDGSEVKRIPISDGAERPPIRALCFGVVDGKTDLFLKKDYGENLVMIKK